MKKFEHTLHNKKVYQLIKKVIKTPQKFLKENQKRRYLINQKLKDLTLTFKYTDIYKETYDIKELESEYTEFSNILKKQMLVSINRSDSAQMKNKLKIVTEKIINKLSAFEGSEKKNFDKVIDDLDYQHMFYLVTGSLLSSTKRYDNHSFKAKNNEALSSLFISNIKYSIFMLLTSTFLKNTPLISNGLVYANEEFIKISNEDDQLDQLTHQIYDIYLEALSLESRSVIYIYENKTRSAKLITIPKKILDHFIEDTHLPEIVKPEVEYRTVDDSINYIKQINNGSSNIEISKQTRESLKISNSKKFRINDECIRVFEEIDKMDYNIVKNIEALPFVPLKVLEYKDQKVNHILTLISQSKIDLIKEEYIKIIKEKIKTDSREEYILENNKNINRKDLLLAKELYNLNRDLKRLTKLRTIHNTMIQLAKIFRDYPIYYINSLDYRLRMYPWNYPFNRTSGIHKYLVCDYDSKKVGSDEMSLIEKSLDLTKNMDEYEIIKNYKNFFMYKILLKREYNRLKEEKNPKTKFFLEIDQRSSSTVFGSILLGDKQLSKEANIDSDLKGDPASKLMNESKNFFKGITPETEKVMTTNREIHKFLLMCFLYNQGRNGRRNRCKDYITNINDCNIISLNYSDLIDKVFGNLSKKRDKINNIIEYFIENSKSNIVIDTLDESRLNWIVYTKVKKKFSKKKYLSPITNKYKSFDSKKIELNDIEKKECVRTFLPGIIHSLDASIMRMIIKEVFKETGYVVNHVHDCIHFSPCYYSHIIKSIETVYQNSNIHLFLDKNVISNLRNNLILEKREGLDILLKDLMDENFHHIDLKKYKINVKNMYRLE